MLLAWLLAAPSYSGATPSAFTKSNPNECAAQPNAFFNKIDRRALEFEQVASAQIAPQVETAAVADQRTEFIDGRADLHRRLDAVRCAFR